MVPFAPWCLVCEAHQHCSVFKMLLLIFLCMYFSCKSHQSRIWKCSHTRREGIWCEGQGSALATCARPSRQPFLTQKQGPFWKAQWRFSHHTAYECCIHALTISLTCLHTELIAFQRRPLQWDKSPDPGLGSWESCRIWALSDCTSAGPQPGRMSYACGLVPLPTEPSRIVLLPHLTARGLRQIAKLQRGLSWSPSLGSSRLSHGCATIFNY